MRNLEVNYKKVNAPIESFKCLSSGGQDVTVRQCDSNNDVTIFFGETNYKAASFNKSDLNEFINLLIKMKNQLQ